MGWGYEPYVPVAQRVARWRAEVARIAKLRGSPAAPVVIEGREIASTVWGKGWCEHLEKYSDYASRLPRGRSYVRNGSVLDLQITPGRIEALVAGSLLYRVRIDIERMPQARWTALVAACAGQIASLIGLLRGELSPQVLAVLTDRDQGLFPRKQEIHLSCSCPDSATLCKHLAAVLYGIGAHLDHRPELLFTLRQVDQADLLAGASKVPIIKSGSSRRKRLEGADLASVFGVNLKKR